MKGKIPSLASVAVIGITSCFSLSRGSASAADDNQPVGDQFKFMGGEKALGETALHKN